MNIIVIRGPAGVGKSTISKEVASHLGLQYISYDDILKKHKLDTIIGDGIPSENFVKANKIVLDSLIQNGAVLDGCFYRKEQINHLIESVDVTVLIFTLTSTIEECISRNNQRDNPMTEQAVHEVYDLVTKLDIGTKIDTNRKSVKKIVANILSLISQDKAFSQ